VIVAVSVVRVVDVAGNEIVRVITMRNRRVTTCRGVNMPDLVCAAIVATRACSGIRRIDRNPMLIDVIPMDAVKLAIVQVIDVAGVFHGWMLAGPVDMIVGSMGFVVRHRIHRWEP
jgi:hypothetical protein